MASTETATLLPDTDSSKPRSMRSSHSPSPDSQDQEAMPNIKLKRNRSSNYNWRGCVFLLAVIFVLTVVLAIVFSAGVVVGRDVGTTATNIFNWGEKVTIGGQTVPVLNWLDNEITPGNIKNNLEALTKRPHIAGSEENRVLAEMIYNQWSGFKFDKVELTNYTVLLSYPSKSEVNVLQLRGSTGDVIYNASIDREPPITAGEDDPTVAPPFNAYSGNGTVQGPLVYVNYARLEDFEFVVSNLSLNLSASICIARYGAIFRGDKAHLAQRYGCLGLVIYSDPEQYAPDGVPVYPKGTSLPPGGVQRGSLLISTGDPQTPGIPSIDGVYRRPYDEVVTEGTVPSIPVQPISYGQAVHFMSQLDSFPAPLSWTGTLSNITRYYIAQSSSNTNVTYLHVRDDLEVKTIHNVVGTIYGAVEPDRQVILGNHRDAWVFGAADPNSGTAILMELARTLGELRKNNWRPGRTLVLCSWDAEEYGLIGSTEWVEDKGKLLAANTVAYLNVDVAVAGTVVPFSSANPLLYDALWSATGLTPSPDPRYNTVYDQWKAFESKNYNGSVQPAVGNLGSGSDYTMFLQSYGISCTDSSYRNGPSNYPVYHSVHDNFYWMSNLVDKDFTNHKALGLVWVKLAMLLSTFPILPYDPRLYALTVQEIYTQVEKLYSEILAEQHISLVYLKSAVMEFTNASVSLWDDAQKLFNNVVNVPENTIRILNDKYMNIERAFIHPEGLPGREYFKHVLFAPSSVNSYSSSLFPGISDSIFTATASGKLEDWNTVRLQIDIVRTHLRYATMIMAEPTLKYAP